jgi:hypothetical protein
MFKGVSLCIPVVSRLYFGPFNPFHYSSLPLYLPPPFSTAINIHPYILYLHRCNVLRYYWCSFSFFSFPFFPEFHRVVPLFNNERQDCKIGTVCVGGYQWESEWRLRWGYMVNGLHIPIWNRTKKHLAIALSVVGWGGLRGRDNVGNVNNVQYKSNQNCHYESSLYNKCIPIKILY